jgi:oligopeptide transport system substrate-binding protein
VLENSNKKIQMEEKEMRNKLFGILSLLVAASLILAACTTPTAEKIVETVVVEKEKEVVTTVEVMVEGETVVVTATPEAVMPEEETPVLRINLGTYPDLIDPQISSFVNEIAHLKLMYEGLTTFDEKLETVPGAAEKWEYNADATELTFTLRAGATYSDGSILNAKRFEYSILRNMNPETGGEYAQITDEIKGANAWRSSSEEDDREALKAAVGVVALDGAGNPCTDYEQTDCLTLKLTLEKPAPYFHTVMALWVTYPAKEELIAEGGPNWWNSSKFQVGNGPYILKSLEPFVRGYFVPNPYYHGGVGKVDIEFSYIVDSAVAFEAYKNNEFDIIPLAAEDLAVVEADPVLNAEFYKYAGSCTIAIMFHQLKEPFTDPKVRAAFAYALDRDAWVADVDNGLSIPTLTWIPPGYPGFKEGETRWGYDPALALQMIAESTYGSVEALPEIVVTFGDSPRNRTRHEWLVAKWKEVFGDGLKISLNPVESTTYTALTKDIATAPQVYRLGWCADYPDPQNWLSVYWKTGAFGERIGYSNAEFDDLVDQADVELDPAKRADLYQQAQDVLVESIPVAFMYNTINTYMVKPWVKGILTTPQDAGWPGDVAPINITIDTSMMP